MAKKNKLPKSIYFFGLAGAILIAMFFTLSQNGHSYESTYELGVPDLLSVTSNQEITQIKCFLKQSTKVYDGNNNQVGDLLQSRFSPTMNPTLAFYSPDNTERGNALAGFNIEPKIRCLNMSLDENDQRKDQFEIAPSTLTLRYYATDNQGNWKLLESKTQKTGAFGSDKTSGNYVQLQYGSESKLGMFSIPIAPLEKKLPEGNYPSTQKFTIEGDIKINWQGYRNQQYTLEVEQDDIKTVSQVQVISEGWQIPTTPAQIKTCVSIEGGDYKMKNGEVVCECQSNYDQINEVKGKLPTNQEMICKEKEEGGKSKITMNTFQSSAKLGDVITISGNLELENFDYSTGFPIVYIMDDDSDIPNADDLLATTFADNGKYSVDWVVRQVDKDSVIEIYAFFYGLENKWEGVKTESIPLKILDVGTGGGEPPIQCNPPNLIVNGECVEPPTPTPTPECDDWLTCSIEEIKDCADRDSATDLALCLIKVEAFYLTGVGILAIGIAGKIFNRRSGGYYGV